MIIASDQCDWPESVDCDFDPSTVNKLTKRTYLYLTFDDGPNEGTPNVLEALRVRYFSIDNIFVLSFVYFNENY